MCDSFLSMQMWIGQVNGMSICVNRSLLLVFDMKESFVSEACKMQKARKTHLASCRRRILLGISVESLPLCPDIPSSSRNIISSPEHDGRLDL